MDIHYCCFICNWLAIMDIHNWIMDIHNWIMDIHNSITDIHNWIIDIHISIMDIHDYMLAIRDIHYKSIMDIHNWIMDIRNYRVRALLAFHNHDFPWCDCIDNAIMFPWFNYESGCQVPTFFLFSGLFPICPFLHPIPPIFPIFHGVFFVKHKMTYCKNAIIIMPVVKGAQNFLL